MRHTLRGLLEQARFSLVKRHSQSLMNAELAITPWKSTGKYRGAGVALVTSRWGAPVRRVPAAVIIPIAKALYLCDGTIGFPGGRRLAPPPIFFCTLQRRKGQ